MSEASMGSGGGGEKAFALPGERVEFEDYLEAIVRLRQYGIVDLKPSSRGAYFDMTATVRWGAKAFEDPVGDDMVQQPTSQPAHVNKVREFAEPTVVVAESPPAVDDPRPSIGVPPWHPSQGPRLKPRPVRDDPQA